MRSEISKREKDSVRTHLYVKFKKKKKRKKEKNLIGKENGMVVSWGSEQDRE